MIKLLRKPRKTSSSAIAEKPRCRMGQFWRKSHGRRWYYADNTGISL